MSQDLDTAMDNITQAGSEEQLDITMSGTSTDTYTTGTEAIDALNEEVTLPASDENEDSDHVDIILYNDAPAIPNTAPPATGPITTGEFTPWN